MSFLSGKTIKELVNTPNEINITGLADLNRQIGPCSIDLRLSNQIRRFKKRRWNRTIKFDSTKSINSDHYCYTKNIDDNEGFVIYSGELILAHSKETVGLPKNKFALITGRSSLSRLGLEIQLTQDLHQPGHVGVIPFQIKNNSPFPIRLYPNMRIAQLLIGCIDKDCEKKYDEMENAKYKNETNSSEYKPDDDLSFPIQIENRIDILYIIGRILDIFLILSVFFTALSIYFIWVEPELAKNKLLTAIPLYFLGGILVLRIITYALKYFRK